MSKPLAADSPAALPAGPPDGQRLDRSVFSLLWASNLLLLIALVAWIWHDRGFMRPAYATIPYSSVKSMPQSSVQPTPLPKLLPMTAGRWLALKFLLAAAAASLMGIVLGIFWGAPRHRNLRAWLALFALIAAWLWVGTSWPDIAWASQRVRVGRAIGAFEQIATPLRDRWPAEDDATPELGAFSAYPIGLPRVLLPLTAREAGGFGFAAVERSAAGGLRFQLIGDDEGVWLEWHPDNEAPASFVGGLETGYELLRSSSLGRGWFLTRYESRPADAARTAP